MKTLKLNEILDDAKNRDGNAKWNLLDDAKDKDVEAKRNLLAGAKDKANISTRETYLYM